MSKLLSLLQHAQAEAVAVGGVIVAGSEGALQAAPSGPVTRVAQILVPILAALIARAKVVPLARYASLAEQLAASVRAAASSKQKPSAPGAGK